MISMRILHKWMGSLSKKGTDAAAGTGGRTVGGFFSAGARAAAPLNPTRGLGTGAAVGAGAAAGSTAFFWCL